jgi:hypothetical protein
MPRIDETLVEEFERARVGPDGNPAADWQSTSPGSRFIASRPINNSNPDVWRSTIFINNRPQDAILPHSGSFRFPVDSETSRDFTGSETGAYVFRRVASSPLRA